ncbi:MAG: DEAD/DEAH box helicase family protein [Candidatus Ratteibacteria bacterium]
MNEAETRAEYIDPKLKESGWGVVEDTRILREYKLTNGRIQTYGGRATALSADYVLVYKNRKLAVIEAKSYGHEVGEGVAQAKNYAKMMKVDTTFSSNGREVYQICMKTGEEGLVDCFPTPEELWNKTFVTENPWLDEFNEIPFEEVGGTRSMRYYQEVAVNNVMSAIADNQKRILLTLATGTGKTFIAFQIAWKLYQTRWNLARDGSRRPRILFLADRNILADQAFNEFSPFPEDALVRIKPGSIRQRGSVPISGNIFFTIFQTFMTGRDAEGKSAPYFGEYPNDFFDFIIIDECHRGGANNESNWRAIMEYFSPALQLGLTATPKRNDNVDTYQYFGEPVYVYALKDGINDGFLTPFRLRRIQTNIDDYMYSPDDDVIEGEIEAGRVYIEPDFNEIIEIKEREKERVRIFLNEINQNEKTIVFCATQNHAMAVRDLINQKKNNSDPLYCVRVTANDGLLGEEYLRNFQDNEKTIPTILTTSQKLSTGVNARNIRNIILMRPINSMVEFKQIIGRGTRIYEEKKYFTIYDFVGAYHHFYDVEWDGDPDIEICEQCGQVPCVCAQPEQTCPLCGMSPCICEEPVCPNCERRKCICEGVECPQCRENPCVCRVMIKVRLGDGREREIQHIASTYFYGPDGTPISVQDFLNNFYGDIPNFFKSEEELQKIWSQPDTRKALLRRLEYAGYGEGELAELQKLIGADKSDLLDVLVYIAYEITPISRERRVANAQTRIFDGLNNSQKEFLEFVLSKYIETGVYELDQEKLPNLLTLKYKAVQDAEDILGQADVIRDTFIGFQRYLYAP